MMPTRPALSDRERQIGDAYLLTIDTGRLVADAEAALIIAKTAVEEADARHEDAVATYRRLVRPKALATPEPEPPHILDAPVHPEPAPRGRARKKKAPEPPPAAVPGAQSDATGQEVADGKPDDLPWPRVGRGAPVDPDPAATLLSNDAHRKLTGDERLLISLYLQANDRESAAVYASTLIANVDVEATLDAVAEDALFLPALPPEVAAKTAEEWVGGSQDRRVMLIPKIRAGRKNPDALLTALRGMR